VATGDGMALALRAGAALRDLEFVQFHPTVLWLGDARTGQQPLISEAVRGEGAILVDDRGERFMTSVHELADLAPRDVVAKAIMRRMREAGTPHVWLDGRALGAGVWEQRFPTIAAVCRSHGIDPVTELVPVAPACHYASGGVATDLDGRTTVPGLYACGEVACSGVHGANRLASNSLLEGLVFARRISADLDRLLAEPSHVAATLGEAPSDGSLIAAESVPRVQAVMTERAGVLRTSEGLTSAAADLAAVVSKGGGEPGTADWQATNLVTVSAALIAGALLRAETRGSHWRDDHAEQDGAWLGHLDAGLTSDHLVSTWTPLPSPVGSPRA
jgi:aspartate oxidase